MLTRLRVKNFKLLRDVELVFADPLTVLIGPNASGKSTVLEVIEFLRRCATDGLSAAVTAHGGYGAIRTAGAEGPIEIETTWEIARRKDPTRAFLMTWRIALAPGTVGALVASESLTEGKHPRVTTDEDGTRLALPETPEARPVPLTSNRQLAFEILRDSTTYSSLHWLRWLWSVSRHLGVLATTASWARSSPDRSSARDAVVLAPELFVGHEGIGLANALYNLQANHLEAWETLERSFRAEYPFVKRIVFPADAGGGKVGFALEDKRFAGTRIYASQMSDGMIAFLTLLVSVLQPEQRGVLALDEPDVHLHPSALRRFVALCGSTDLPRSIILVTHSNALLDALDDPAKVLRIVEPGPDGTRVRTLDPTALAAWRKEYTLSEMRTTGLLDANNTETEVDA